MLATQRLVARDRDVLKEASPFLPYLTYPNWESKTSLPHQPTNSRTPPPPFFTHLDTVPCRFAHEKLERAPLSE